MAQKPAVLIRRAFCMFVWQEAEKRHKFVKLIVEKRSFFVKQLYNSSVFMYNR